MTEQRRRFLVAVISGGVTMGFALGARHVQGLFLVPMTMDRGWTREAFAFAIAIQNLVWGFTQPLTGMIADRFGALKVILVGALLYALGLVLMSCSRTPVELTLSAGLIVGVALSCTAFGSIYGALSKMVDARDRPWALGLAGAIGGLGQFAMVPSAQGLIDGLGWSWALVAMAIGIAVVTPACATIKDNAAQGGSGQTQSMSEAIKEAFRHRGFWLLNLGFLACGFQLAFIASHLPAYLLDRGLKATDAVAGLAIIALTNIVGTYCGGYLGGMFRRKYLLASMYLARSLAMTVFVLLPTTTLSVYVFSAVMGFLWLGAVPLTNGLVGQVFGVRYLSTLFGFVFVGHQIGSFLGVWLGGVVFDITGSYNAIWFGAVALGVIAAMLHWPIDDRELTRTAPLPVAA